MTSRIPHIAMVIEKLTKDVLNLDVDSLNEGIILRQELKYLLGNVTNALPDGKKVCVDLSNAYKTG